ncbi:MAG: hypothetical protein GZ091_05080 [Paludibacter sp.]|nr:hypothetical protein [Paludibacter sp.]
MRIELATSSLPRKCSTTELQQQKWFTNPFGLLFHFGAKDGTSRLRRDKLFVPADLRLAL